MRLRLAIAGLLVATAAIAQIMVPGREMAPNTNGPGPPSQNMIPNLGEMTPNALPPASGVVGCAGTGYNFTLACNSQYIVVL